MIAIVLSGGGNRGPLQVGALQALFDADIWPDLLVGTSAGALNAMFMAACGEPSCPQQMGEIWRRASRRTIYPGSWLTLARRLLDKENSLYSSSGVRRLLEENLPAEAKTFGDLKIPCYVTSVDLSTSTLYLFGEDPAAPLVEAVMASSAVPGIHPPVDYHGLQLVDGGVLDNVPASIAMDKGATTIYAVNVGYGGGRLSSARGVLEIFTRTLNTFMAQSLIDDLERADEDTEVDLHHIHIVDFAEIAFNDFDHVDEMIEAGRKATEAYLAAPRPRGVGVAPAERSLSASTPGVSIYVPPHRR